MAGVVLEGITKVFPGGVAAVRQLSLEVVDREFMVLVGPSGCGKTTTLRMIAGLEEVSEGEIRIGDRVVTHVPPRDRNIAMVFQNYALYPHMSVYKNMAFGLKLRYGGNWIYRLWLRMTRPEEARQRRERRRAIPDQVRETARSLGIEPLLGRMPRQLSGGERQRVALGRAIVRQPAAFLFDEPLSNLDAKLRVEMRRELKQLHQRLQATMIYVTHDQVEALTLGDRIAVLHEGRLQQVGPAMQLYDRPANRFVAGFIGSPPMNLLSGAVQRKADRVGFRGPQVQVDLPALSHLDALREGRRVALGVRPEDVAVGVPDDQAHGVARVVVVESLGDSVLLHMQLAAADGDEKNEAERLICKTKARTEVRLGDTVSYRLDPQRVQLFDESSSENLTVMN